MKERDNLSFASLDGYTTQEAIFVRSLKEVNVKWCKNRWTVLHADIVPFEKFASCIKGQAIIHRQMKAILNQHMPEPTYQHRARNGPSQLDVSRPGSS